MLSYRYQMRLSGYGVGLPPYALFDSSGSHPSGCGESAMAVCRIHVSRAVVVGQDSVQYKAAASELER